MLSKIKLISITCENCGTTITVEAPDMERDPDRGDMIKKGVESMKCPICKQSFDSSIEGVAKEAAVYNATVDSLENRKKHADIEYITEDE